MAYLAKIDRRLTQPVWVPSSSAQGSRIGFTPLQWSIILDAPQDPLASLRPPGRLRRFARWLAGDSTNLSLANPHLEALRRTALLTWHYGFTLPANELSEFLAAGFSLKQFELMAVALRGATGPDQKFARPAAS